MVSLVWRQFSEAFSNPFRVITRVKVQDLTSEILDEVCVDLKKEPILQEVKNEDLPQEASKSKKALLISVHSISGRLVN